MVSLPWIEDLAELAGLSDPRVQRLVENAKRFPESREGAANILLSMCRRKGVNLAKPPAFSVPEELPHEGHLLGQVLRGEQRVADYRHPDSLLPGNLGVFGGSGVGKSTFEGSNCERWIENRISTIILDNGDEYGWLIDRFPVDRLLVLRARNVPLALVENPVGSCLTDLARLSQVVGVLREGMFLRDGSSNLLTKIVGDLFRERKVLQGSRNYPLASEIFRELITRKFSAQTRHAGFLETLVNRFQGLLQSFPGMNARRSLVPAQVLQRSLIVRMADLSPGEVDVFVGLFLAWLMSARQGVITSRTEVVIVLEEAHLVVSEQKASRMDLTDPIAVRLLRMGRKHGISVCIVDQVPSELPPGVLGNVATRVVFRLTNSPCVRAISHSMGLDRDEAAELAELAPRRALVQTPTISKPFLLQVVEIPERHRPTEAALEQREKESLALLDHEMSDVDVAQVLFGGFGRKSEGSGESGDDDEGEGEIRGDLLKVLARICEKPHELIEDRAETLEMDRAREYRARACLEKLGMIQHAGTVGAKCQLYEPTAKGVQWARDMRLPVHTYKSGVEHEYMTDKTRKSVGVSSPRITFISAGESLGVSGVQPDLLARIRGADGDTSRRVAFQISCSNKPEYEVQKALELSRIRQIDLVVVVAKNKRSKKVLEEKVKGARAASSKSRPSDAINGERGLGRLEEPASPVVLDFETCTSSGFDWSWLVG